MRSRGIQKKQYNDNNDTNTKNRKINNNKKLYNNNNNNNNNNDRINKNNNTFNCKAAKQATEAPTHFYVVFVKDCHMVYMKAFATLRSVVGKRPLLMERWIKYS